MKNKLLILFAFLSIGFASCDLGDDPAIGGTATKAFAGEYFVQLLSAPGGDVYVDYTQWTISNTAANVADKIRISDNGNVWNFSGVFTCDVNALTFSGDAIVNPAYDPEAELVSSPYQPIGTVDTVAAASPKFLTITGGAIYPGAAHVPSKTVADSIAFYGTGIYYLASYMVVGYDFDTTSTDPLTIDTLNRFQLVEEFEDVQDGPYFLSGFQRTGFLEDEH